MEHEDRRILVARGRARAAGWLKVGSNLRQSGPPDIALLMAGVDETGPFVHPFVRYQTRSSTACMVSPRGTRCSHSLSD